MRAKNFAIPDTSNFFILYPNVPIVVHISPAAATGRSVSQISNQEQKRQIHFFSLYQVSFLYIPV